MPKNDGSKSKTRSRKPPHRVVIFPGAEGSSSK
jgi:hypothetical protein